MTVAARERREGDRSLRIARRFRNRTDTLGM